MVIGHSVITGKGFLILGMLDRTFAVSFKLGGALVL